MDGLWCRRVVPWRGVEYSYKLLNFQIYLKENNYHLFNKSCEILRGTPLQASRAHPPPTQLGHRSRHPPPPPPTPYGNVTNTVTASTTLNLKDPVIESDNYGT